MKQPPEPDPNELSSDLNEVPSSEDPALINFLHRYGPAVPEPASDLENQILQAVLDEVATPKTPMAMSAPPSRPWQLPKWGIPTAIAATITLLWGGTQLWRTATMPPSPDQQLEAFVADSWSGAFDPFDDPGSDLLGDPWDWWGQSESTIVTTNPNVACERSIPCPD